MHAEAFSSSRFFNFLKKCFRVVLAAAHKATEPPRPHHFTVPMTDPVDPAKNPDALSNEALRSLNFGPSWASGKAEQPKPQVRPERDDERGLRRDFGGNDRRDRRGFDRPKRDFNAPVSGAPAQGAGESRPAFSGERPAYRPRPEGGAPAQGGAPRPFEGRRDDNRGPRPAPSGDRGPRRDFGGENRGPRREFSGDRGPREGGRFEGHRGEPRREIFRPAVKVDIYPEEKPFGVLLKAVKASCRTYELFEIAKTILEKNERFVVSVRPLDAEKNPDARLYQSVPDQLVFLTEYDAVAHALNAHADTFFTAETVETEAPKGVFTTIARCGFTGEFLAPPNYHGYQKTLRDHFASKIGDRNMPFERFVSRVETVKDEAAVAAWLESKTKLVRYTLKDPIEGETPHYESLDAVQAHLFATRKDKLVKAVTFIRFSGKTVETLPPGPLRATVEHEIAFQRKFPLDTANSIRGRLRKAGFALYKRGAKGVTYLCGVKRKFRTAATPPFSDEIKRVFDLIESSQDVAANKFIHLSEIPEKLLGIKPLEAAPAPKPTAAEKQIEAAEAVMEAEGDPQHPPEEAAAEAPPKHTLEETIALSGLAQNIRWLVTEGYVTEFSNGRLFALPVMTEAQAKAAAAEDESHRAPGATKHAAASGAPVAPAVESIELPDEPETSEDGE